MNNKLNDDLNPVAVEDNQVEQSLPHPANIPTSITNAEDAAQKNHLIWYACYGSNLAAERFTCYLQGGRVKGMSHDCVGARDATPVRQSHIKWMPYRVFFAHVSKTWGHGGAAMLDVMPNQTHECCMRLYMVTLQQFNDIVAQENNIKPPLPITKQLTRSHLQDLQKQGPHSFRVLIQASFYPAVVYLGERDDIPIVTFTCVPENVDAFLNGKLPAAPPSESYIAVMTKGLQELGVDEEQAGRYWEERIRSQTFVNYDKMLN